MVECLLWEQDAAGSNPVTSTSAIEVFGYAEAVCFQILRAHSFCFGVKKQRKACQMREFMVYCFQKECDRT